jgi:hypothetical protein
VKGKLPTEFMHQDPSMMGSQSQGGASPHKGADEEGSDNDDDVPPDQVPGTPRDQEILNQSDDEDADSVSF